MQRVGFQKGRPAWLLLPLWVVGVAAAFAASPARDAKNDEHDKDASFIDGVCGWAIENIPVPVPLAGTVIVSRFGVSVGWGRPGGVGCCGSEVCTGQDEVAEPDFPRCALSGAAPDRHLFRK